jgi:RNA polymerase sigma-70 factor (ECF subfamily)
MTAPAEAVTNARLVGPEADVTSDHRRRDDWAFVQRLRRREPAAFSELLSRHHGSLLRTALVFVSSRAVAEEVVQETWLALLDGIDRFEGRSQLKTWLFGVLINRAKTRATRERATAFVSLSEGAAEHDSAVPPERFRSSGSWAAPVRNWELDSPERRLMNQEALQRLEAALAALPPAQKAVVILHDIEGLEPADICNALAISEANQRVLLHRARSRLRAALENHMDGK